MRVTTKLAVGLTVTLSLSACDSKIDRAKEAVARDLIDPSSAQFRDVKLSDDGFTVCGEINGKNRLGAYVGFMPFMVSVIGKDYEHAVIIDPEDEIVFSVYFDQYREDCLGLPAEAEAEAEDEGAI